MKFSSGKLGTFSYIVHVGHILQGEADNFCSSCVDVFIPHKGQVARQRLYIPELKKQQKRMHSEVNFAGFQYSYTN